MFIDAVVPLCYSAPRKRLLEIVDSFAFLAFGAFGLFAFMVLIVYSGSKKSSFSGFYDFMAKLEGHFQQTRKQGSH